MLHTADGQSVLIQKQTPTGAGIHVIRKPGRKQFYPVPIPTVAMHRKLLPLKQAPAEMNNEVGPFVLDGRPGRNKIWFANTFYDGEGLSGVGAVGAFDISSRKYDIKYLPEIAPWSGSAILLDGENLWIGLMRRPEGASYGTGLLRYKVTTGEVTSYPVTDYVYTLDRVEDTLYCGTSHGLYTVRGSKITQLRFEPDGNGKLLMVAREVRP